jgi:hypothetical protein
MIDLQPTQDVSRFIGALECGNVAYTHDGVLEAAAVTVAFGPPTNVTACTLNPVVCRRIDDADLEAAAATADLSPRTYKPVIRACI